MSTPLTQFTIIGLHGKKNFEVPIRDNKLVLVGENGTGKSTVANLIYFFLTRQWRRLREYKFQAIRATLGSEQIEVTPEKIEEHFSRRAQADFLLTRHSSLFLRRRIRRWIDEHNVEDLVADSSLILSMSDDIGISPNRLRDMLATSAHEVSVAPNEMQVIGKKIASLISDQFLYLPTYRRIEQDLQSIFRGADLETEIRKMREGLSSVSTRSHYVELVQFGMGDVENTILKRMAQIKESVRTGLDNLIGTYLRDVIRGTHVTVDVAKVQSIDPNILDSMFARIDEATLPTQDKELLKNKIADITTRHRIEQEDQVIAHFLFKLAELYSEQEANERDVRDFVKVCNEYLAGKQLVYDNAKSLLSG